MDNLNKYLATLKSDDDRALAKQMYQILVAVLPDAEVKLSYGLVGFYQPKQICFFGINKQHIGFYPTDKPIQHFKTEIAPYLSGKTTLKFQKSVDAIPEKLIQEIALWNLEH